MNGLFLLAMPSWLFNITVIFCCIFYIVALIYTIILLFRRYKWQKALIVALLSLIIPLFPFFFLLIYVIQLRHEIEYAG